MGGKDKFISKRRRGTEKPGSKNDEKTIEGNEDTEAMIEFNERREVARRKSVNISHEKEMMVCFQELSLKATAGAEEGQDPGLKAAWCSGGQFHLFLGLRRGKKFLQDRGLSSEDSLMSVQVVKRTFIREFVSLGWFPSQGSVRI